MAVACLAVIWSFDRIARRDTYAYTLFENQHWLAIAAVFWWVSTLVATGLAVYSAFRGSRILPTIVLLFLLTGFVLRFILGLWVGYTVVGGTLQFHIASPAIPGF